MWAKFVALTDDNQGVIAKLTPDIHIDGNFSDRGLIEALQGIKAEDYFVIEDEVNRFLNCAKEGKSEAFIGITIAQIRNASVDVVLSDNDMIASMVVTGAYKGRPLNGPQIVQALANAKVTKGINKLALKKVLAVSHQLKPGETYTQAVAAGKNPVQGQDAKFVPLVKDVTKQVLAPNSGSEADKVDLLNLGETITVGENEPLMKRIPATKGTPGMTVLGEIIKPAAGKNSPLKPGKGSHVSADDADILLASIPGMPIIKSTTVDVEDALYLPNVGVATGHVKFKGNVIVAGNIESDMIVRATGSITVGGFIESADVQAQGDIEVGKGIIGHTVSDGDEYSCSVKSGASIRANYAQYAQLQAGQNIELAVHALNNEIRCGQNLIVMDNAARQGTLSGGKAKVGGKVVCVNLGVEGDTATYIHAFARFQLYKERQAKYKAIYRRAQEGTMQVIRQELEFKKKPKSERSAEEEAKMEQAKQQANQRLEKAKQARDELEIEFENALADNSIEIKNKVFTHVTVQFGSDKVTTRRIHGPTYFTFNQYEIKCSSMLGEGAVEESI
ncbi:hypothetical protein SAMN04488136_103127 [Vibrio xiamenensis]|uniref:Flagellar Assembly Protein A N-terminal region domain-containing protein n=1 Tax=Vibrio xiamenensis TaxID=861298 RepID=A0A1G7XF24_9VIBR|nr:FapA family protein [Vibrio xiamenensis]SDG82858.1 hypothetical protein SAMN04488136_103127 [Vibrio xiamenensis]